MNSVVSGVMFYLPIQEILYWMGYVGRLVSLRKSRKRLQVPLHLELTVPDERIDQAYFLVWVKMWRIVS